MNFADDRHEMFRREQRGQQTTEDMIGRAHTEIAYPRIKKAVREEQSCWTCLHRKGCLILERKTKVVVTITGNPEKDLSCSKWKSHQKDRSKENKSLLKQFKKKRGKL